jgi:hypothetical protein
LLLLLLFLLSLLFAVDDADGSLVVVSVAVAGVEVVWRFL